MIRKQLTRGAHLSSSSPNGSWWGLRGMVDERCALRSGWPGEVQKARLLGRESKWTMNSDFKIWQSQNEKLLIVTNSVIFDRRGDIKDNWRRTRKNIITNG
jgi:hypothetical protein